MKLRRNPPRLAFEVLSDLPLFRSLSEPEEERLAHSCCRKRFARNSPIIWEGHPAPALFVLLSGGAYAAMVHTDGRAVLVHLFLPGDCFGEMAVHDATEYPYSVACYEESEVLLVSLMHVQHLFETNAAFARDLAGLACSRHLAALRQFRNVSLEQGADRVLNFLRHLAREWGPETGEGLRVPLRLTHQLIAQNCGMSRETVSRLVGKLCRAGRLVKARDGWTIPPSANGEAAKSGDQRERRAARRR